MVYFARKANLAPISRTSTSGMLQNIVRDMAVMLTKRDTGFFGSQLTNLMLKADM